MIYVHLLNWFGERPKLVLPDPGLEIRTCRLLTGGPVRYRQSRQEIVIEIPPSSVRDSCTLVELECQGDVMEVAAVEVRPQSLAYRKNARSSSEYTQHKHWPM